MSNKFFERKEQMKKEMSNFRKKRTNEADLIEKCPKTIFKHIFPEEKMNK